MFITIQTILFFIIYEKNITHHAHHDTKAAKSKNTVYIN